MQAFTVTSFETPPEIVDIDCPSPAKGQVRIKIEACGLNFADLLMAKGTYQDTPQLPFALGMEAAGVIDAIGPETDSFPIGTRVAVFGGFGGLAEYGIFPAERCIPVPDEMPSDIAAGFIAAYGTSHLALTRRANLQSGETLLVLGAAGGVGLTAVEIGKALGATVIAAARGANKCAVAAKAGADHTIDTSTQDIREVVLALGGADVVYDPVGGDLFKSALRACNREARVLAIGFASGDVPQIPANILLVKNITVIGFYWGGYLTFNAPALTDSLTTLMTMYQAGQLHPHISHVFPLSQAKDALDVLQRRVSTGKVVVVPDAAPKDG